jgi:hypothetical protein
MAHGGARKGAGRPAGMANRKTREIADKAITEGLTPLEYMLSVMRDETAAPAVRLDAAKSAASYVHPRLSAIDANLSGDVGLKVEIIRFAEAPAT